MRLSSLFFLSAISALAAAQSPAAPAGPVAAPSEKLGVSVRVSYGFSGDIRVTTGGNKRLEGPEIAFGFPVVSVGRLDLALEPSVFFGGRLRHGSDIDGDVYRILFTAKHPIGGQGLYLRAGGGFAQVSSRSGDYDGKSGAVGELGFGFPISGILQSYKPNLEFRLISANAGQLRGAFFGITAGF